MTKKKHRNVHKHHGTAKSRGVIHSEDDCIEEQCLFYLERPRNWNYVDCRGYCDGYPIVEKEAQTYSTRAQEQPWMRSGK